MATLLATRVLSFDDHPSIHLQDGHIDNPVTESGVQVEIREGTALFWARYLKEPIEVPLQAGAYEVNIEKGLSKPIGKIRIHVQNMPNDPGTAFLSYIGENVDGFALYVRGNLDVLKGVSSAPSTTIEPRQSGDTMTQQFVVALEADEEGIQFITEPFDSKEEAQRQAAYLIKERRRILDGSPTPYGPFNYTVLPLSSVVRDPIEELTDLKAGIEYARSGARRRTD